MSCSLVQNAFHLGIDKGEAFEGRLVHGVNKVFVAVGQIGLFTQELPVKVTAITGRLLLNRIERERERGVSYGEETQLEQIFPWGDD